MLGTIFNRDEWKLQKKQEKINKLLRMTIQTSDVSSPGESKPTDQQGLQIQPATTAKEILPLKQEENYSHFSTIDDLRLQRLSRRNKQFLTQATATPVSFLCTSSMKT